MQINVSVTDANNIVCEVVPPQPQIIVIDRGVEGNGIVSIVPVTISTFQYLRITYTNGTVQDVGPLTSTAYTATAPITIVGNTISLATVPIASGGTDATTAAGAIQNLLPSYTGNANKRLGLNSLATALEWVADGGGTVTSINASGGTTGLTFSGGPITSSGTLTLSGTLAIANGGTGQITANAAFNALAPSQTGNSGKYLTTDGTNTSWATNPLGTVTSVGGTGTVSGITLSGTVTTSGNLTLGGTLDLSAYNGAGAFTTLSASSTVTLSGGTANGVAYLNGSKGVASGSALTFDGTNLGLSGAGSRFINLGSTSTNGQSVALQISAPNSDASANVYRVGTGLTADNEWVVYDVTNTQTVDKYIRGSSGYRAFYQNGSEAMRLTSTGLGIGTSSPTQLLNVRKDQAAYTWSRTENQSSSASAYAGLMLGAFGNSWGLAIGSSAANSNALTFILDAGGSNAEKMRLDSSGNLGLGVTPSAWQTGANLKALQVGVGTALFSDTNSLYLGNNVYQDSVGTSRYINTNYASKYQQTASSHQWYTAPSGTAGNAITFTQAMTLDASGRLGIGTTSPGAQLTVIGSAAKLYVDLSGDNYYDAANHVFRSFAGTERARIDLSGNLLVNTTSTLSSAHQTIACTAGSGSKIPLALQVGVTTDGYTAVSLQNQAGAQGSIAVNTSSVSYNTSSDYRLKNSIAPMTGALAKVALLKPCTYKWNADGSDGEGFIAHELAEVVPQCVTGEKDAVDEEGNPKYQGIDTSFLVATLTAALQEAVAKINSLEARLDAANL